MLDPFGAKLTRADTESVFWSLVFFLRLLSCDAISECPAPPENDTRTDFTACKSPKPQASYRDLKGNVS